MRKKNEIKNYLLIDISGLPQYAFAKNDKSNVEKLPVPRNSFQTVNFSYSGDFIAISTSDKNSYIGILSIDESLAVQGGDQGGEGGQQGGQQGGGAGQGGGLPNVKEKPIGKEIVAFDILKDSKVEYMCFSPDEKVTAVQYKNSGNSKCLRLYSNEGGDIIPFKFEENYNLNNVDIVLLSFEKDIMDYEVIPKPGKSDVEKNVAGKWEMNLKDYKVKRK